MEALPTLAAEFQEEQLPTLEAAPGGERPRHDSSIAVAAATMSAERSTPLLILRGGYGAEVDRPYAAVGFLTTEVLINQRIRDAGGYLDRVF